MLRPDSPGVYVEEVPAVAGPIAGVGTSTAGFIGKFPYPAVATPTESKHAKKASVGKGEEAKSAIPEDLLLEVPGGMRVKHQAVGQSGVSEYLLPEWSDPNVKKGTYEVRVDGLRDERATLEAVPKPAVKLGSAPAVGAQISVDFVTYKFKPLDSGVVKLCTKFSDFTSFFGDFSTDPGHQNLAHAVFGFFNNGGTRCYVVRVRHNGDVNDALKEFEGIDEIAIVAAPGIAHPDSWGKLVTHCTAMKDRVAILDSEQVVELHTQLDLRKIPNSSDYAAFYFPWIQVFDPATKSQNPEGDGLRYVPPSGHIAGLYANVDATRGVHKAPANHALLGVTGLKYEISKSQQDGLNPKGVNCIRNLNGNVYVWGARTIGGDDNNEFRYISTRRYYNYLRESIEQGTQFVVFEPNSPSLWERIKRTVGDFLLNEWRNGALFGDTPKQAFFVQCDAETNPLDRREAGEVTTEVGVAIVKPAEFVIFRIQQHTGG